MFCYGNKESWYKKIVPSGMLPAVQIDGQTITESDEIVEALESTFGPLNG
jgi:glutathione S-transferase